MKLPKQIITLIFFVPILQYVLIYLAFSLLPFAVPFHDYNFLYPPNQKITLQSAYSTWDAQHYVYLSEKGYHAQQPSNAFAPLFPGIVHLVTFIVHNSFWAGYAVVMLCSIGASVVFYLLVHSLYNEKIAQTALSLFLFFPTAFYLHLLYSEAVFLFLVILFFYSLQKKQFGKASIIAFFIPMARLIGIFIVIPFSIGFLFEGFGIHLYSNLSEIGKKLTSWKTLYLLSPLLGALTVLIFMWVATGNPFSQVLAQRQFVSQYSALTLFNPLHVIQTTFSFPLAIHGFTNSILDRLFFLLFLALLIPIFKTNKPYLAVYALLFGLAPVLGGSYMSYMRYLFSVFPLVIALSVYLNKQKFQFLLLPVLYLFIVLQTIFIVMHALNFWVG